MGRLSAVNRRSDVEAFALFHPDSPPNTESAWFIAAISPTFAVGVQPSPSPGDEAATPYGATNNVTRNLTYMNHAVYGMVHFYLALATAAAIVLHVCLHRSWVCATCCNLLGIKAASPERQEKYGALLLLLLIVVTIAVLYWAKTQAK